MIYNSNTIYRNNINILEQMEYLPEKSSNNFIGFINVYENKTVDRNLVDLEEIYQYMQDNNKEIDEVLQELAEYNDLDISSFGFTVRPSSIYFNEEVSDLATDIFTADIPIYFKSNFNTKEYQYLDSICEVCEQEETEDYLDIINEGIFSGGVINGLKRASGGLARGTINGFVNGARSGIVKGTEQTLDRNIYGRLLDRKTVTTDKHGNTIVKTLRNQAIRNKLGDGFLGDTADDMVDGVRKETTKSIVANAQQALGINPKSKFDIKNVVNALNTKINHYKTEAETSATQQGENFAQRMIKKLEQVRDNIFRSSSIQNQQAYHQYD